MALLPHIYIDAALTEQWDSAVHSLTVIARAGLSGTGTFYVGDPDATIKLQDLLAPGVDPITVTIADATPAAGIEVADCRLALSQGGLAAATPGAALSLGTTILGGVANAVAVWFQATNNAGAGTFTDITLTVSDRAEVPV